MTRMFDRKIVGQQWLLILVATCILTLVGLIFYTKWQEEENKKQLAAAFDAIKQSELQAQVSQGLPVAVSIEEEKGLLSLNYDLTPLQETEKEKVRALRQARLSEWAKKAKTDKNCPNLFVYQYATGETGLNGVKAYQINELAYRAKVNHFEKQDAQHQLTQLYLTDDYQRFSLDRLIKDPGLFVEKIRHKLIEQGLTEQVINEKLLPMQTNFSETVFSINEAMISIQLSEDDAPLELPYQELYDVLQIDYLGGEARVAYETYLAEKAAAEKAEAERLAKEEAVRASGHRPVIGGRVVALTFDDGPNPTTTPQIIDILNRYGAKGTFFVLGQKVAGNEDILKNMLAAGHQIANHTWSHPDLTKLTPAQIQAEVNQTQQAIQTATGVVPTVLRPPYGSQNASVAQAAGLPLINWTVDTLDWKVRNTAAILGQVKAQLSDGGVILMHDIHSTTVAALPAVMDYLKAEGYSFVTINELYGY